MNEERKYLTGDYRKVWSYVPAGSDITVRWFAAPGITNDIESEVAALNILLEHAPQVYSGLNPDLFGWRTPLGNELCTECVGRIHARGCSIPKGSQPVWVDSGDTINCVLDGGGQKHKTEVV